MDSQLTITYKDTILYSLFQKIHQANYPPPIIYLYNTDNQHITQIYAI